MDSKSTESLSRAGCRNDHFHASPSHSMTTCLLILLGALTASAFLAGDAEAQIIREDLYVTNGGVSAAVPSGNTLYIGGDFTEVGPATGGWVPIDSTTGAPVSGFPKVAGYIWGGGLRWIGWLVHRRFICGRGRSPKV